MRKPRILVTGKTGSLVVAALLEAGYPVRAMCAAAPHCAPESKTWQREHAITAKEERAALNPERHAQRA